MSEDLKHRDGKATNAVAGPNDLSAAYTDWTGAADFVFWRRSDGAVIRGSDSQVMTHGSSSELTRLATDLAGVPPSKTRGYGVPAGPNRP